MTDDDVRSVESVLSSGSPVCTGSYHSVLLVGYENDPSLQGGGRFFISDSNPVENDLSYEAAETRFSDLFWVSAIAAKWQAAGLSTETAAISNETE